MAVVATAQTRPRIQDAIPVELVQLGKPRDPRLLPRKVKPPPPPPPSSAPEPTAPAVPDAVPLESKADPQPAPKPQREPELSAAARRLLEQAEDRRLDEALAKLEEPEGSPEGFAGGTTTDPSAQGDAYLAEVRLRLQQAYSLPETISAAERPFLEAVVLIRVAGDGSIVDFEFTQTHPNRQFMGALRALLERITLPAPPAAQARDIRRTGIQIRFKPR
jgi:hypothetical protein